MQIDFHLGVTYILARMSGFSPFEANTIASASQFVDDAVNQGTILFQNRSAYQFICSAHRMLDYRNFKELATHHVWIPFHFIPGNEVRNNLVDPSVQRLICRPNSDIAQDIVKSCVQNFHRPYGYHLLGVTTHAYADTWAHQGFAGITHEVNRVGDIFDDTGSVDTEMLDYRDQYFKKGRYRPLWRKLFDTIAASFVSETSPIGHGPVLSYPDLPYLQWSYQDWQGQTVKRDNPKDYMEAIEHVLDFYARAREQNQLTTIKRQQTDLKRLEELIRGLDHEEPEVRLARWKTETARGAFSFGQDTWSYSAEGAGSWLEEAFDWDNNDEFELINVPFKNNFLTSNWKRMHDALLFYRFSVLHEVLPKYDICVS